MNFDPSPLTAYADSGTADPQDWGMHLTLTLLHNLSDSSMQELDAELSLVALPACEPGSVLSAAVMPIEVNDLTITF